MTEIQMKRQLGKKRGKNHAPKNIDSASATGWRIPETMMSVSETISGRLLSLMIVDRTRTQPGDEWVWETNGCRFWGRMGEAHPQKQL